MMGMARLTGIIRTSTPLHATLSTTPKRPPPSLLAGDAGTKATHLHHSLTSFLAVTTPLYFLLPSSYTDGTFDVAFGSLFATVVASHSWIGMNYVATDYVPKISKGLVGPARVANAALGVVTLVGLGLVATNGKGGIKGAVLGLWRPKKVDEKVEE